MAVAAAAEIKGYIYIYGCMDERAWVYSMLRPQWHYHLDGTNHPRTQLDKLLLLECIIYSTTDMLHFKTQALEKSSKLSDELSHFSGSNS